MSPLCALRTSTPKLNPKILSPLGPPTHPYPIPLSYLLRMNLVEDKVQLHQSYEKVGETIITEIFIVYHEVLN